ncbi:divalent-cation tolerance protein CutA [Candidatus Woesearchaeota archaeon CG10_big_fil_rev_8_21_14_0_10_32_9]|nr:MAG: divalent-cation tolerance protein CutA [Candidatus Woesearchaeota archaeon CG10_big_fil_rev_8_21_14_0_10_32_9]
MSFIIVYVTHKNLEEAKKIASHLLEKKLIACANFFPISSSYWWKGSIETSDEIVSLLKTKNENWIKLKNEIKKIHPYETPCIMKLNVEANEDYESWILKETK